MDELGEDKQTLWIRAATSLIKPAQVQCSSTF